ncbi:MAG: DUF1499 domain-containing protein [Variibacter sp.]|nr:DUF1499 domain-containing protein [Variibacter sp.]
MVRRLTPEEPPSRLAIWSRRLALFALAVALFAIVLVRGSFVEAVPGFAVLAGALALAALAILAALGAFVVIWVNGNPGLGRALLGLTVGLGLVAYPAYIAATGYDLPPIADISTDTADPPQFEVVARVRPRGANPIAYPGPEAARQQRAAYPDIMPLQFAANPQVVYRAVLDALRQHKGLLIIDERSPRPGGRDGRIEAVARTTIMGFRDDVVVRVRARGGGTVVDIRSASRYGTRDFGTNARRIRSLAEAIEDEIGNHPEASR